MRKHFALIAVLAFGMASCLLAQDSAQGNSQPANVAGKWQMSWQGRHGTREATLQLQQDGAKLTGTLDGERGSMPVTGSVDGNNISFSTQGQGRQNFSMVYTGTIDGDKMTGSAQPQGGEGGMGGGSHHGGGQRNHSWTATRQAGNSNPGAAGNDQSEEVQPGF
ncbi:MAG: hypothetical protein WAL32_16925 [Terriglobales bacterium]